MNNAVYDKAMENLKNRVDVRVVNNVKDYLKWTWMPGYIVQKVFDNDLVAVHKIKITLAFNKPVYITMCILE